MEILVLVIFALGYIAITMEHTLKVDKLVPALLMMALCWTVIALGLDGFDTWFDSHNSRLLEGFGELATHSENVHETTKSTIMQQTLLHHLGKTAEILFFLMGAMTIVEITDHFEGFASIKRFIKTKKKSVLLWIMAILAFFLSAIIDNLTATIVLITILRKLVPDQTDRWWFAGMIVVTANAGGAWSPIGDVTTTMLWMGHKVSAVHLVEYLLIPSAICMIIPTIIASKMKPFRGTFDGGDASDAGGKYSLTMLILGLSAIVFVPIFKTVTHLPPYVGMMISLAVVAIMAEIFSNREFSMTDASVDNHGGHSNPVHKSLGKIEMPSILFFLGILLAVAALESLGMIFTFGQDVQANIDQDVFVMLLGGGSAVIDNVPLVAASMGMFTAEMDAPVWHFIAYAAGTGGSMLIIGSAAGVVAMGMEKISFFWYLKKIAWLALVGYIAGAGAFLAIEHYIL